METEMIDQTAVVGINRMMDYGIAMTVIAMVAVCTFYLVRYLLQRCDERFTESLKLHRETTQQVLQVVDQNTKAITEFRMDLKAHR